MPAKLKLLFVVMAPLSVFDLMSLQWQRLVLNGLIALGVLRGNEVVRVVVIFLASASIALDALVVVGGTMVMSSGHIVLATFLVVLAVVGIANNVFTVWCLRDEDVKAWMFHRSLGPLAAELA